MGKLKTVLKAGSTVVELGKSAQKLGASAQTLRGAANELRSADKGDLGRTAGRYAFNEGAGVGKSVGTSWLKTFEVIPRIVCRALQFLFAIIACGFYGNRVDVERKADDGGVSAEWIFAVLVASLSSVTAVLFIAASPLSAIPYVGGRIKFLKTYRAFAWDAVLFVGWLVVFGIFAGIFLKRKDDNPYKGSNTSAMKGAVWIDFVNAILWLVSGIYGATKTFLGDKVDDLSDRAGHKIFSKDKSRKKDTEMGPYAYASSV